MTSPDFTGERFIPGQGGAQIAYEHVHRYLFALRWARGKRVLDVAAGSGYGAAILAGVAAQVSAVELDETALAAAREDFARPNLLFLRADARHLPVRRGSMDLVVALEILEHIAEQDRLIHEIARVLRPAGVALISTPDRAVYSDKRDYSNPFHVRELYREEFLALLRRHFGDVLLLSQQVRAGSLILPEAATREGDEVIVEILPREERDVTPSMYSLALCSPGRFVEAQPPAASAYMDPTDFLLKEEMERIQELGRWGQQLEQEVQKRDAEVEARDKIIRQLQEEMKSEIGRRDDALTRLHAEFEDRSRWVQSLRAELSDRDEKLGRTQQELDRVAQHLARIRHALLYRILCRLGILPR